MKGLMMRLFKAATVVGLPVVCVARDLHSWAGAVPSLQLDRFAPGWRGARGSCTATGQPFTQRAQLAHVYPKM